MIRYRLVLTKGFPLCFKTTSSTWICSVDEGLVRTVVLSNDDQLGRSQSNSPMLCAEADIKNAPFPVRRDGSVQEMHCSAAALARYRGDLGLNGSSRETLGTGNQR